MRLLEELECLKASGLSSTARLVLLVLAIRGNEDGGRPAWPSQEDLAETTGLSVRSVQRSLALLVEGGFIRRGEGKDEYFLQIKASSVATQRHDSRHSVAERRHSVAERRHSVAERRHSVAHEVIKEEVKKEKSNEGVLYGEEGEEGQGRSQNLACRETDVVKVVGAWVDRHQRRAFPEDLAEDLLQTYTADQIIKEIAIISTVSMFNSPFSLHRILRRQYPVRAEG